MNQPELIDPGSFNRQMCVENYVHIADGCGGFVKQVQAIGTIWAKINPAKNRRLDKGDNAAIEVTHQISCRFNKDVEPGCFLITGSRRFLVHSITDLDETRRYIVCECTEQ